MRAQVFCLSFLFAAGLPWAARADAFGDAVEAYRIQDYAAAVQGFKPLAEDGDARAQFALGLLHDNGEGLPQSDRDALRWYEKSAAQGYAKAQYNLGVMTLNGRGLPRDDRRARVWFERAAAQGAELTWTTPQEMGEMIRAELGRWRKVVSDAGIKPE